MRGVGRRVVAALACVLLLPAPAVSQTKTTYKYDALGRLTEVQDTDEATGITSRPAFYKYDPAGNRTRVASSPEGWRERAPVAFTASSTDARHGGVSGLSPVAGMADREIRAAGSVHVTQSHAAGEAWVRADLGASVKVDAVDVIPANVSAWSVGTAELSGAKLQYSADASTWTTAGTVSGVALNTYTTIATDGVEARYWRLWREAAGVVAVGDFRLFGGDLAGQSLPSPDAQTLAFEVEAGQTAQFNPFQLTTGAAPRAIVAAYDGGRTKAWVDPAQPDLIQYRAEGAEGGSDTFTFVLRNGDNSQTTYTVNLVVRPATLPPAGPDTLTYEIVAGQQGELNAFKESGSVVGLTLGPVTQGARTTVWVQEDRPDVVLYRVNGTTSGIDTFTFQMKQGATVWKTYTVRLVIFPAPASPGHPPFLYPDSVKTNPGSPVVIYPLANDRDPDGDAIRLENVIWPGSHAEQVAVDKTIGKLTYTPWFNFTGEVTIRYTVVDAKGDRATNGLITVNVQGNQTPTPVADDVIARPQVPKSFNPLLNDTDADGDRLTLTTVTQPQHGTAAIGTGQTIVYTAAAGYGGPDSFSYAITDGRGFSGVATGTVNVTVQPNSAPQPQDDAVLLPSGGASTFDPRTNDTDLDGDELIIRSVSSPSRGQASVVDGGMISYTPTTAFTGTDSFSYTVEDGHGGVATALITITVDPDAVEYFVLGGGGGGGSGAAGGGGGGGGLRAGVVRLAPGSHAITVGERGAGGVFTGVGYPPGTDGGASSIGALVVAPGGRGGSSSAGGGGGAGDATPPQGYPGGATAGGVAPYMYNAGAGGGGGASGPGQSGVTSQSGSGGAGVIARFTGLAVSYADGGGGGGYYDPETAAAQGMAGGPSGGEGGGRGSAAPGPFSPHGAAGVANRGGGGGGGGVLNQPPQDAETGNGGAGGSGVVMIRYPGTPRPYGGVVTQIPGYILHTFTATGVATAPANRRPMALNDSMGVRPGTSRTIDPRVNDRDPDGDPLKILSVGAASHGAVNRAASGEALTYTPNAGATADSFTYTVSDGRGGFATATVAVTVQANTAPNAVDDSLTVSAGLPRTLDPRANDTDPQGDRLVIRAVGAAGHGSAEVAADGQSVAYTAAAGYVGPDSFTYTVDDGQEGVDTATVNVTVAAQARVFTISPPVGGKGTWNLDLDGSLNLGAAGRWMLTPQGDFIAQTKAWGAPGGSGQNAAGAGGHAEGAVLLRAGQAYRIDVGAPGANAPFANWGAAGGGFTGVVKPDGVAVFIAGGGGGAAGGAGGSGGGSAGETGQAYNGHPGGAAGTQSVGPLLAAGRDGGGGGGYRGGANSIGAYGAASGGGGGSGYAHPTEVTGAILAVGAGTTPGASGDLDRLGAGSPGAPGRLLLQGAAGANTSPTAVDDARTITFSGEAVLDPRANDYDPNGDRLAVAAVGAPAHGVVARSGDLLTYTPQADYVGSDTFSYTIDDGRGGTATGTVVMTVTAPTNTPPQAVNDVVTALIDAPLTFDPRQNDVDVDRNVLSVTAVGTPGHGTAVAGPGGGSIVYTPAPGYLGADSFTYALSDGHGGTASASVAVTVVDDDAPVAIDDAVVATGTIPKTFDPRANDTDADGDTLTITRVTQPAHGVATISGDGTTITYAAIPGHIGSDTFSYTVSDGVATATANVAVSVTALVVTWNQADKNGNVTLSNGDLSVSAPATEGAARATLSRASGKYYYEGAITSAAAGSNVFGVMTSAGSLANAWWVGRDVYGYGYAASGGFLNAVAGVGGQPTLTTGDRVGVAVDLGARKVWWSKNGTWLNGSPGAGTGGLAIAAGAYFPAASVGSGAIGTANFGASAFAATLPRGFLPWDGSAPPGANHVPIAANDSLTLERNTPKVFDPRVNDTDSDGDTLVLTGVAGHANGTLTIAPGGTSVTYTPNPGFVGPDSFSYTVSDGAQGTATATVTVTVVAVPVAWSTTDKHAGAVLSNGNLTFSIGGAEGAVRATLSRASGRYYYEADVTAAALSSHDFGIMKSGASLGGYVGSDALGYGYAASGAVLNGGTAVATQPTLTAGDRVGVAVDFAASKIWWSKNGTWLNGSPALGTGGLAIAPGAYFPAASNGYNAVTTANFGASAFSGVLPRGFVPWDASAPAAANRAPVAANDTLTVVRDTPKVFDTRLNDMDLDGDQLVITRASGETHGIVAVAPDGRSVTYTPNAGYLGPDSFSYTLSDGMALATATVAVTVTPPPVTWSATDKNSRATLSVDGLAFSVPGTEAAVRASLGRSSGKYYYEGVVTAATTPAHDFGIMTSAASLADGWYVGRDAHGYGYAASGNVLNGGGAVGTLATLTTGDRVGVAVDLGANRIWWSKNGTWLNGNPATGAGGLAIAAGTYLPAASVGAGGVSTANFGGSSFGGTVPSGFAAWDGYSAPAP